MAPGAAPGTMFPKLRALGLPEARKMALTLTPAIALAQAQLGQAQAQQRDVNRRIKIDTTGGLDPFSGDVRFYLGLDLERLVGLNRAEKERARQVVEAERIGQTTAQNAAIKAATVAWYGLRQAEASVTSGARLMETTQAIKVSADARFRAGAGELSGVLSALRSESEAVTSYEAARQSVALAALDLAQSCGYATAEEMEAAL